MNKEPFKTEYEKALEVIFRDYSYHLQYGMDKEKQKEFFDTILEEIEALAIE